MTPVAFAGGARTPICRAGGSLRAAAAMTLATVVARAALEDAGIGGGELGVVVASCALPADAAEIDLATSVARQLGADGAVVLTTGGLATAGLAALFTAIALCEHEQRAVLVVGADSASRVPYWANVPRDGAGKGDAVLLDPLGAAIAAAAPSSEQGRARQDAFALRSHALARSAPAERVVAVAGASRDEPASAEVTAAVLAGLKPVFDPEGTSTAGNTGLPADGAAALVLVPGGAGPRFGPPREDVVTAEVLETSAAAVLADPRTSEDVNPAGGAIGQGLPLSCGGLVMVLRLAARLAHGQAGALRAGSLDLTLSA